jgi:hypothetical protein
VLVSGYRGDEHNEVLQLRRELSVALAGNLDLSSEQLSSRDLLREAQKLLDDIVAQRRCSMRALKEMSQRRWWQLTIWWRRDHPVRAVWAFVEGLDLRALHDAVKAREGVPGQAPPAPELMMALWLWATVDGIGSARQLARDVRAASRLSLAVRRGVDELPHPVGFLVHHATIFEMNVESYRRRAVLERRGRPPTHATITANA